MVARYSFWFVLGLIPLLLGTSLVQALPESSRPVAGASPTSPDGKQGIEARDKKTPAGSPLGSLVVRHLEKRVEGKLVAETPHFRILHDQGKPIVDRVGQAAEETRTALQRKWFGEEAVDWDGKCTIYLHEDRAKYASKTGLKNTLGHMRTLAWGDGVIFRSIHLPCKEPNLVEDVLPHEVSHSVMAVRLQGKTPRWADEGMAVLAEKPASVQEWLDRLPRFRKTDSLFSLEVLMQTDESEHFNSLEYYAQSTSLVQFLVERKDPPTFIHFLRAGLQKGYEPALKQHYAIQGFADLERQWRAYAFKPAKK